MLYRELYVLLFKKKHVFWHFVGFLSKLLQLSLTSNLLIGAVPPDLCYTFALNPTALTLSSGMTNNCPVAIQDPSMCNLAAGFSNIPSVSGITGWNCSRSGASASASASASARPSLPVCQWTGVSCTSDSFLSSISLQSKGFVGTISNDIGM